MFGKNIQHAFILGCERSGSTWLANVLDAHPDTEVVMEPFADLCDIFPGFPNRNLYVDKRIDSMTNVVSKGYENIFNNKYPLFYQRGKSLYWKVLDRSIINLHSNIGRWQRFDSSTGVKRFHQLNLNMKQVPIKWQVDKTETASLLVTKELRLNYKVGVLRHAFPQAKYIIIVRHPGAQVTSVMKLFNRGNLGELKRSLSSLYAYIHNVDKFKKYSKYFKRLDGEQGIHRMLLLWWLINYETVLEDCKRLGVDYMIVYHEDLSNNPDDRYREVFAFLGLTYSHSVRSYITRTTTGNHRVMSEDVISPVDTTRNSSRHSRDSISNVDADVMHSFREMCKDLTVCDELRRYVLGM